MAIVGGFLGGGGVEMVPAGYGQLYIQWLTIDRQNLSGASFNIQSSGYSTIIQSGSDGRVSALVPTGTYTISITHSGNYANDDPQTVVVESAQTYFIYFYGQEEEPLGEEGQVWTAGYDGTGSWQAPAGGKSLYTGTALELITEIWGGKQTDTTNAARMYSLTKDFSVVMYTVLGNVVLNIPAGVYYVGSYNYLECSVQAQDRYFRFRILIEDNVPTSVSVGYNTNLPGNVAVALTKTFTQITSLDSWSSSDSKYLLFV